MTSIREKRYDKYDRFYLQDKAPVAARWRKYQRDCDKKFGPLLAGTRQRGVLDIGCANGMLTAFLKQQGFTEVVGIDINSQLIEQARKNVDAEFVVGDAETFLKSGRRFDIIFMLNIIEHIERDRLVDFMTAVHQALKPDGLAIIRTPNMNNIMASGHLADDLTHCTGLTEQSLGQLASLAGFTHVEMLDQFRMQNFKGKIKALYSWLLHKWLWCIRGGAKPKVFYRNLYASLTK